MFDFTGIPSSRYQPSPRRKDEPQNELDCSGEFNAAPDIRKRAGSRWRLSTAPWGKGQGIERTGLALPDTPKTRAIMTLREISLAARADCPMLLSEHAQCALWLR
jgi:hypothetical protein